MDLGLKDKIALVTGGASGIGAAIVRMLANEGARVAFADQNESAGARLLRELSGGHGHSRYIPADLTRETDCQRCVAETLSTWGGLDILINNAGVNDAVGLEGSPDEFMA